MFSLKKFGFNLIQKLSKTTVSKVVIVKPNSGLLPYNVALYQRTMSSKTTEHLEPTQFQEPTQLMSSSSSSAASSAASASSLADYKSSSSNEQQPQQQHLYTKVERELIEFLTNGILTERKALKTKIIPTSLDDWHVKLSGAEIELSKQIDKQKMFIKLNVTHTVDTEAETECEENDGKPREMAEMRSKPRFEIDFIKHNTTLSFTCAFLEGSPQEGEYNDIFGIEEMCIFDGVHNDKVYAVAGDVLDDTFYDLLMNFLEEKGISNEFVAKLSDLATAYEHASYIKLMENLNKFTSTK